jgi:hypothetical protein
MRVKACVDGCVSEIPLHVDLLFLRLTFDVVEFDPLSLDVCEMSVLCSQGVDVSDDPSVAKVEQRVVYDKAVI